MISAGLVASPRQAVAPAVEVQADAETGSVRICTRFAAARFLFSIFADGIPVLANDFSQSCDDGPRIFPSMYASPGQRVQPDAWVHELQVGRSFRRIERTSFIWSECLQTSINRRVRTFPVGKGNWTHGKTSPYGET